MRLHDVVDGARGHNLTTTAASLGAYIYNEVGMAHHLLIVLHDKNRVASIAQLLQCLYQAAVVALMQTDARLIEDVEYIHKFRTDLRSKTYALALATRE